MGRPKGPPTIRATVAANRHQNEKRFSIAATSKTIEDWKTRTRAQLLDLPAAVPGKWRTLAKDVVSYLDTPISVAPVRLLPSMNA